MNGIELFNLTQAHADARGFSGAVCDGRYIYLAPLNNGNFHGRVARYDVSLAFDDVAAWSTFDSASLNGNSRGFVDAIFDGRYLYLVPYFQGSHHGQVTRYDTQAPFDAAASWQFFDTSSLQANCRGFVSGCFDGRYVYLSPYQLDFSTTHGQVVRYDTQADFLDAAAWQYFDTAQVDPNSKGFHSAVCEGDYIYFVPYLRTPSEYSGLLARYDRRLPFDDVSAWRHYDLTQLAPGCKGYVGGMCHDGMLYLSPYVDGTDRHGRALRFDTRRELDDVSAWTLFDCAQLDAGSRGFFGAIYAEGFLYLVPHCRGVHQYHGQITRCDLSRPFDDRASWSYCDLTQAHADCRGFIGGVVHDGYLYLPPFETDAGQHSGLAVKMALTQVAWVAGS